MIGGCKFKKGENRNKLEFLNLNNNKIYWDNEELDDDYNI